MKKSKHISKYEVEWQIIRSSIKGGKTSFDEKISRALNYLTDQMTEDRWERVYNWLEGLERGYKAARDDQKISVIKSILGSLDSMKEGGSIGLAIALDEKAELKSLKKASDKEVITLYRDLCKTNEGWLSKGYFHGECNEFIDYIVSVHNELIVNIKGKYTLSYLKELRLNASEMDNNHKFFF